MLLNGTNPMRWDCAKDDCFNKKRRPKIEVFAECFPGRINFGDVDGMVELKGCFCLLEWKGTGGALRSAQRIAYENLTRYPGNIVFVVEGDAETMAVRRYGVFWRGKQKEPMRDASLRNVKDRMRGWVAWVLARKKGA